MFCTLTENHSRRFQLSAEDVEIMQAIVVCLSLCKVILCAYNKPTISDGLLEVVHARGDIGDTLLLHQHVYHTLKKNLFHMSYSIFIATRKTNNSSKWQTTFLDFLCIKVMPLSFFCLFFYLKDPRG